MPNRLDSFPVFADDGDDDLRTVIETAVDAAYRKGMAAGENRGRQSVLDGLAAIASLNGTAKRILKAKAPEPEAPPEPDSPHLDAVPPDARRLLSAAMVDVAIRHAENDTDPTAELNALAELANDPGGLHDLIDPQGGTIAKAFGIIFKAWSEDLHPRNDAGRFISREKLQAAKSDPKKAAALLDQTTKPAERAKLEAALSGKSDVGHTKRSQARADAAGRRSTREESHSRASRIAYDSMTGDATPEHFAELASHLPNLTVKQLRDVRGMLGVDRKDKRKAEIIARLVEHAGKSAKPPEAEPEEVTAEPTPDVPAHPSRHNPEITYANPEDRDSDDKHFGREIAKTAHAEDQIRAKLEATVAKRDEADAALEKLKGDSAASAAKVAALKAKAKESADKAAAIKAELAASKDRSAKLKQQRSGEPAPSPPAGEKQPHEMTREEHAASAPSMIEPTEDNLPDIGNSLRAAMEEVNGSPKDQCMACAWALKSLYPDAEIWEGLYRGEPHTLAKLGGKFIDVTADQFDSSDSVQVLDPDNLPNEYRRFDLVDDNRDPSVPRWDTHLEIAKRFKESIGEEAKERHGDDHFSAVATALRAGKPVPPEVLADYPDLQAKYGGTKPAAPEPASPAPAKPAAAPKDQAKAERRRQIEADVQRRAEERLKAANNAKKTAASTGPLHPVAGDIQGLLNRFKGVTEDRHGNRIGHVPVEDVTAALAKLDKLPAPELLRIARQLNSAATLTEKSPAAKIRKQITEMVRRVWKTSDNVLD